MTQNEWAGANSEVAEGADYHIGDEEPDVEVAESARSETDTETNSEADIEGTRATFEVVKAVVQDQDADDSELQMCDFIEQLRGNMPKQTQVQDNLNERRHQQSAWKALLGVLGYRDTNSDSLVPPRTNQASTLVIDPTQIDQLTMSIQSLSTVVGELSTRLVADPGVTSPMGGVASQTTPINRTQPRRARTPPAGPDDTGLSTSPTHHGLWSDAIDGIRQSASSSPFLRSPEARTPANPIISRAPSKPNCTNLRTLSAMKPHTIASMMTC